MDTVLFHLPHAASKNRMYLNKDCTADAWLASEASTGASPEAWVATEAAIGVAQVGLLRQDVAGARRDGDGQVPDLGAGGGGVGGDLFAILVNRKLLQVARHAESVLPHTTFGWKLQTAACVIKDMWRQDNFEMTAVLNAIYWCKLMLSCWTIMLTLRGRKAMCRYRCKLPSSHRHNPGVYIQMWMARPGHVCCCYPFGGSAYPSLNAAPQHKTSDTLHK